MDPDGFERATLPPPRYEYGADDWIFVELAQEMSLDANFKTMALTNRIREHDFTGITEICPANASYMLQFDPAEVHPDDLIDELQTIEDEIDLSEYRWETRVVDFPLFYNDPWTRESLMKFRDRHQGGVDETDLEYSARINGLDSVEEFITVHSSQPYMATMIGFVPGLAWTFKLAPRDEQLEVPKYLEPRTETPGRAVGCGGAFTSLYPAPSAGGYQLIGRTPIEIVDVEQRLPGFEDSIVFFDPGDIINYRPIDRQEYDSVRKEIEEGSFEYTFGRVEFSPDEFFADPRGYNRELVEVLA